jgi:hypothetical protein
LLMVQVPASSASRTGLRPAMISGVSDMSIRRPF